VAPVVVTRVRSVVMVDKCTRVELSRDKYAVITIVVVLTTIVLATRVHTEQSSARMLLLLPGAMIGG